MRNSGFRQAECADCSKRVGRMGMPQTETIKGLERGLQVLQVLQGSSTSSSARCPFGDRHIEAQPAADTQHVAARGHDLPAPGRRALPGQHFRPCAAKARPLRPRRRSGRSGSGSALPAGKVAVRPVRAGRRSYGAEGNQPGQSPFLIHLSHEPDRPARRVADDRGRTRLSGILPAAGAGRNSPAAAQVGQAGRCARA